MPSSLRVLIVEADSAARELIQLTLNTAALTFTVTVTETLAGFEQLLSAQSWDVVLSDYRLPGFTAYQVLALLQQSGQQIPLILVTDSLGEAAAIDCIKAGMTDYVLNDRLFRLPIVLERSHREFELRRQQQVATAQMRQQSQRQTIINRIVQAMRETLVLDEVLQKTVDMVREVLVSTCCLIVRPARNGELIVRNVSEASPGWQRLLDHACEAFPYYEQALQQGEMVLVHTATPIAQTAVLEMMARYRVHAFLIVPLLYQREFLGGLSLYQSEHDRIWTDDEVAIVKAIADQCAIAIHQAQLFQQVQQQAQREQLLNQIARILNSSLDPDYILQEITRLTGTCFAVDRAYIFEVKAEQVRILDEWRASPQVPSMLNFTFPLLDWADLLDPHADFYVQRVFHAPIFAELEPTPTRLLQLNQYQIKSLVGVPIFIRDRFFGGIALTTTTALRQFTNDEIHLLQQISDQAAIALYNAQSYERLEQLVQFRTQEVEHEKRLSDAANRAKSDFLANMSHELRTPLTGILGFSSLLLKQIFGPLNAKQQQYVENIAGCGEHLLSLINDLLDLSKIEAGQDILLLEAVPIQELCTACLAFVREQAQSRGLQIVLAIAPDLTTCTVDLRRTKQILVNLLANAVKFTDQGTVTLMVEKAKGSITAQSAADVSDQPPTFILFHVSDTGIGIAPNDLPKLFQPFQQLDSGLDKKYQGTGLGLALARKLAQLHGGDLTVTSEIDRGSCFTLSLPINSV